MTSPAITTSPLVERLNQSCFCISLDSQALRLALDSELGQPGLSALLQERCPHVFSAEPVFVAAQHARALVSVVQAIESVVAMPAYQAQVLAQAPTIARQGPAGPRGAFLGFDFHLHQGRLGLIEINTNAGGAMLNTVLARAQRACCPSMDHLLPAGASITGFEDALVAMARQEWLLAGHSGALSSIAIVDTDPQQQYLYPEFLLFQQLFERHGIHAVVVAPQDLVWRAGRLWHGTQAIDLVYNRLTDFYLENPAHAALRDAWLGHGVVLSPDPRAHALYADKRHLALFSDAQGLQALGVPQATRELILAHVPRTEIIDPADAARLWDARRQLFFKPIAGYGSRGTYRGDKLTRKVWQEILQGGYVAQAIAAPGERVVEEHDSLQTMKFDLRAYAYAGSVQWLAARLYQGQTTNFRTPGGGFAPVYTTPP